MTAYYDSSYAVPHLMPDFTYDLPLDATSLYRTTSQISANSAPSWASSSSARSYTGSSPSSPAARGLIMTSPDLSTPLPWLDPVLGDATGTSTTTTATTMSTGTSSADALLAPSPIFDAGFGDLGFVSPVTTAQGHLPSVYTADLSGNWNTPYFPVLTVPTPQPEYTLAPTATISGPVVPAPSTAPRKSSAPPNGYCCLVPGCNSRIFKRKADLERHYRHVHMPANQRDAFFCDYPKCSRAKKDAPFHRRDHLRDHYREYHKDEIVKRGAVTRAVAAASKSDAEIMMTSGGATSSSEIKRDWWRCAKCLRRTGNVHSECQQCKVPRRASTTSKK